MLRIQKADIKFNYGLDGIMYMIEQLKEQNIKSIGNKLADELQQYHPNICIHDLIQVSQHNNNDYNKKIINHLTNHKQIYMVANTKKEYLSYSDDIGFFYNTILF